MKNLSELLKGCSMIKDESGRIVVQSIRNMQVVCLTTADEFSHNRFANPMSVIGTNRNYGHLNLANGSDQPTIVPAQIAIMTKESAQNHGMVKGAYIPAKTKKDFNDAGCVQGSQTGYITGRDQTVRFIPFGAREYLFEKSNKNNDHSKIYEAIEHVGRETGANSGKYLDQYFQKYDKQLEEFIAHFERPEKTIGVIVLVDGEIIAIDKFPSFEYAEQVWDALIRDCYGAIAITQERKNRESDKLFTKMMSQIKRKKDESVTAHIKRVLSATKDKIADNVRDRLSELMDVEFATSRESSDGGYLSELVKHEGYVGQAISEGGFYHLVSVCKKDAFSPERFRAANEMRTKARKQDKFEL